MLNNNQFLDKDNISNKIRVKNSNYSWYISSLSSTYNFFFIEVYYIKIGWWHNNHNGKKTSKLRVYEDF